MAEAFPRQRGNSLSRFSCCTPPSRSQRRSRHPNIWARTHDSTLARGSLSPSSCRQTAHAPRFFRTPHLPFVRTLSRRASPHALAPACRPHSPCGGDGWTHRTHTPRPGGLTPGWWWAYGVMRVWVRAWEYDDEMKMRRWGDESMNEWEHESMMMKWRWEDEKMRWWEYDWMND